METRFIKIKSDVINISCIKRISEMYEHNDDQLYFHVYFNDGADMYECCFYYTDFYYENDDDVEMLRHKLKEEKKRLDSYLLSHNRSSYNEFFKSIDVRKCL